MPLARARAAGIGASGDTTTIVRIVLFLLANGCTGSRQLPVRRPGGAAGCLGRTLPAWRTEPPAHFDTGGASNGPTEAMNLLIEKRRRAAHASWRKATRARRIDRYATQPVAKLWNTLVDLGEPGVTILTAWIAKEELRSLLAWSQRLATDSGQPMMTDCYVVVTSSGE